ncbi:MAG: hypothetical protein ACXWJ5_14430 [Xanthobacteraceae bacterium]
MPGTIANAQSVALFTPFCAPDPGIGRFVTSTVTFSSCNWFEVEDTARRTAIAAAETIARARCGALLKARSAGTSVCGAAASGARWMAPGTATMIGSNINGGPAQSVVNLNSVAGHCALTALFNESNITQSGSATCQVFFHKYAPYRISVQAVAAYGYVCVKP